MYYCLAAAATIVFLLRWLSKVNLSGKWENFFIALLFQSVLCDCLESLLYVNGLLGGGLEVGDVTFALAPCLRSLVGDHTLVLEIYLITQHNKGKVVGITGTSLDKEFVSPAVQVLERLGYIDVEHQHAAVSPTIESHTETLKPFLTCGIPNLHGYKSVVHHNLFCQEVSANGSFVLVAELFVNILVHEGGLSHPAVSQNDDL